MNKNEIIDTVKKHGEECDSNEIRKILRKVKNNLIKNIDTLKRKKYTEGWGEILEPLRDIDYIIAGFFANTAHTANNKDGRKILAKFITCLNGAKNSKKAYQCLRDIEIGKGAGGTVASTFAHIIHPEWFLAIANSSENEMAELGLDEEDIGFTGGLWPNRKENIIKVSKYFSDILKDNDLICASYALFKAWDGGGDGPPPVYTERMDRLLSRKRQIILYGPPGTGKTYLALNYVKKEGIFITFHQSFGYEEFIEGIRPIIGKDNNIRYVVEDGIFKTLCLNAVALAMQNSDDKNINEIGENFLNMQRKYRNDKSFFEEYLSSKKSLVRTFYDEFSPEKRKELFGKSNKNYYIVIDEINRGNISKIFGDLITLLEIDKRAGAKNEIIVHLPYSNEKFCVPPNIYIIGTMNTTDRSIALIDVALRRRFAFMEMEPDYTQLENIYVDSINISEFLRMLNSKIEYLKDRDHRIGHSYFMEINDAEDFNFVWYNEVVPLILEYFHNDWETIRDLIGPFVEESSDSNDNKTYKIKKLEGKDIIDALKQMLLKNENNNTI